jgi:hypothetical protein
MQLFEELQLKYYTEAENAADVTKQYELLKRKKISSSSKGGASADDNSERVIELENELEKTIKIFVFIMYFETIILFYFQILKRHPRAKKFRLFVE